MKTLWMLAMLGLMGLVLAQMDDMRKLLHADQLANAR